MEYIYIENGESFPDVENINHKYNELKLVFDNQLQDWKSVLSNVKGINRNKISGAIIHTDQGSQYTSKLYTDHVLSLGCTLFYSRKGNPYDNTCIESLFE